jgi:predicted phage baseplate assembly protein
VPSLPEVERPRLDQLTLPQGLLERVRDYLDERRLLTTALRLEAPPYVWVSAQVRLKVRERLEAATVQQRVEEALYRFLHPLVGGKDGEGWPFGRDLFIADIYALVQRDPGVDYISDAKIYPININSGSIGSAARQIPVPEGGVVASYRHLVVVE